jgi:hypothetical protein
MSSHKSIARRERCDGIDVGRRVGPSAADPGDEYCTFTLSPPARTQLGSGAAVTASLAPQRCSGKAKPNLSTVCVSAGSGPSTCQSAYAWNTATVFLAPWRSGDSFTATGNGCWLHSAPATPVCTPSEPITVRL